ncbi:hypothetical protein SAY86_021269 [Trapa natans]|uniref:Ubiquitin-like protease family profile domain-containing protein n=1 Tax=Trapa natans TaxID=22666 RepID=A0AAN7MK46_TRANT|nr:hypothetical protein SAY86_021269 [Trapa natans]
MLFVVSSVWLISPVSFVCEAINRRTIFYYLLTQLLLWFQCPLVYIYIKYDCFLFFSAKSACSLFYGNVVYILSSSTFQAKYFVDEVKDKNGKDIDVRSWKLEYVDDLPEQENSYDCGVFMIKYADFYSRGLDLCFSQEHMPYFRHRTAKEILKLRAD